MRKLLSIFAVVAALSACALQPVAAQEAAPDAPVCDYTLAETIPQLNAKGIVFVLLPTDAIDAFVGEVAPELVGQVTNVLLTEISGAIVYGLEVEGCLLPPVVLVPPQKLSGRAYDGRTGA